MIISRMDISFWRRRSKQKGKAVIYCRISVGGERIDIGSTGVTVDWNNWDGERVKAAEPQSGFWNEHLDTMRSQLRAHFNDLFRKKEPITAAKIRRLYEGQNSSVSLLSAFELYLKECRTDVERNLVAETITVYDNVRKKLTDFLISRKATDLLVEDFDLTWIKAYRSWMKKFKQENGKVGHADSYIAKQTQTIKNVIIWAKLNKLADKNPLDGYKVKGITYGDPVFLTNEEFEKLLKHHFKSPKLQQIADLFIILCRTGFHYGDLEDFIREHKTALRLGIDGEVWLMKARIKTDVMAKIPQFDEVKKIVAKYGGWDKLPLISLVKFNYWLKLVAAEMNLHPELSSKAGRKTFTDWCFNTLGLTTDAIKVLLGRKSDKGMEVYGRPDERRVSVELKASKAMKDRRRNRSI
ncbi:site-specific integrase [Spirosoma sp. RP8]|uniref:Site-specific integrase n=1 Tax=Spirosoma liriopis TaxID=2937440 RepID=A0ABT0HNN3_9BACT|nr:phage integrase SAM-like domain-containing protein [Spirosoma liriopis]MCK8493776.1 site-specific integrase [Spirosoma liriopis]